MGRLKLHLSPLDRMIAAIAPGAGLKRAQAKLALDAIRAYEGAAKTGRRAQWKVTNASQNKEAEIGAQVLRDRARDLVRNNAWSKRAMLGFAADLVGSGIKPKFKAGDQPLADYDLVWWAWASKTLCDAEGSETFYGIQRLAAFTVFQAGECFIRKVTRPLTYERDPALKLPSFCLQVLEPEFLDLKLTKPADGIIQGIQYRDGLPIIYHLFDKNPAESSDAKVVPIPATDIIHLFDKRRAGQARGITEFDCNIEPTKSLDDYEDATIQQRKIGALLSAFLTGVNFDDGGDPVYEIPTTLEPGGIVTLPEGADLRTTTPPMVSDYRDFQKGALHKLAAGLGRSYESLTSDYSETNYSSARASKNEENKLITSYRDLVFIPKLCDRVGDWFLSDLAVMAKPDVTITWISPPVTMIDPTKETEAYKQNVRSGFMTLNDVITKLGGDPDEVLKEYSATLQILDTLGIKLDTDPRQTDTIGRKQETSASETTLENDQ